MPSTADIDASSPMEEKLLGWLQQAPVISELGDQVEIDAQFELGQYLRQLDPTYDHPNYKVDFLVKVRGERSMSQIIIEYDGFKEHFEMLDEVDASNYEHYMKPTDIERQKILEGYGYRFLRINRFNSGMDPVKTLDERLRRLLRSVDIERQPPQLIEELQRKQASLESGESKVCSRCKSVKSEIEFFDERLQEGRGGYGRICRQCKGIRTSSAANENRLEVAPKSMAAGPAAGAMKGNTYLNCPYAEKEECKALGGKWDPFKKKWYVPVGLDLEPFEKWR